MADNILNYTETIENLERLQYDGVNYIYDLEPLQKNFFYLDAFYDPFAYQKGDSTIMPSKLQYRIQNFSTDVQLLQFEADASAVHSHHMLPSKDIDKQVTITWLEDAYSSIQRYHMNWSNSWYNKDLDCMVCGQKGKFRNMRIVTFHYVNVNNSGFSPIYKPVPISQITFCGLYPPEKLGKFEYSYAADNKSEISYSYHYNKIEVFYFPFYSKEEKDAIGDIASIIQPDSTYSSNLTDASSLVTTLFNTGIDGFKDNGITPSDGLKEIGSTYRF